MIVPAFNEAPLLARSMAALVAELSASDLRYEIVVVDDASTDATGALADGLAVDCANLRVMHHESNGGIGAAIRTGVAEARGELLIVSPVDSPLRAEELRAYVALSAVCDIVVGRRDRRAGYSWWMRLGAAAYPALLRLLFRVPLHDFNWIHLYRKSIFQRVTIEYGGIVFLAEVLIKAYDAGFKLRELPVQMQARTTGRPTISRPRVLWHTGTRVILLWWRLRGPGRHGTGSTKRDGHFGSGTP